MRTWPHSDASLFRFLQIFPHPEAFRIFGICHLDGTFLSIALPGSTYAVLPGTPDNFVTLLDKVACCARITAAHPLLSLDDQVLP